MKVKHPVKTALLTTLLATISAFGGCWGYKNLKKTPTPEELWKKDKEITERINRELIFEKNTTIPSKVNQIDKQRD